jgi:hypothetical protein
MVSVMAARIRGLADFEAARVVRWGTRGQRPLHLLSDLCSVPAMSPAGARAEAPLHWASLAPWRALARDVRGVVIVEYVVVLLLVSGLACSAIVLLGMAISKFYMSQEAWIGLPLP